MTTHVLGQTSCANSKAAPTAHRRNLLDLLAASPVITDEEYDTATARILACQSVETLQKWYRNTIREIARREEAAAIPAPVRYATAAQTSEVPKLALHRTITDGERTHALRKLPTLTTEAATALVGALWGRIVLRTGGGGTAPAPGNVSYSQAA